MTIVKQDMDDRARDVYREDFCRIESLRRDSPQRAMLPFSSTTPSLETRHSDIR